MPTLGDENSILTWANYYRWPLYGFGVMILGAIVGLIFGSILGLAMGAVAGFILGALIGLVMGKDSAMFPVIVEKWVAYSGGAISPEGSFPARVRTITFTDASGGFVEPRRVEYLQGTQLRKMPPFSLPTWFKEGTTRRLQVLQLDTFTFRPIIWKQGAMIVEKVPVYKLGENGQPITDAEGKPIQQSQQDQVIFDTNYEFENDKLTPISRGVAAKLDNERASYAEAVRTAYAFNQTGDFWAKYGSLLFSVLCIGCILIITIYAYIKFDEMAVQFSKDTSNAVNHAADSNAQAAYLNAQVAQALLKAGFSANVTFVCAEQRNQTQPQTGGGGLVLPIVGKIT